MSPIPSGAFVPGPGHERMVVLTGAGLSARTGLGTFRGPEGIWALRPELERAMHASALPGSLPDLWSTWGGMMAVAVAHGPTPGHRAIARMGAPVITQNIDGLHQAAGSEVVAELHGSALRAVCMNPRCDWSAPITPGEGDRAEDHGVPGHCPRCGEPTRPDVVLFEEALPEEDLELGMRLARGADLMVAVGTSGVVFPAAQLVPLAKEHGATTVLIDVDPPLDPRLRSIYDHVIAADAHEVLPAWERSVNGGGESSFLDPFGG